MDWIAELVRVTLFVSPSANTKFEPLFATLVGKEPSEISERPKLLRHEVGPVDGGHLFVTQQSNRVDIQLGVPNTQTPAEGGEFVSVGQYGAAKKVIEGAVQKLFAGYSHPITRLAFAPTLLFLVAERVEGYKALIPLLPTLKFDPEKSRDLFWQINRLRPSKVLGESVQINRVAKWSVAQSHVIRFDLSANATQTSVPQKTAVRLELDISTPSVETFLPREKLPEIYNELRDLADEISVKGDVE
jgi:hypothetical protein